MEVCSSESELSEDYDTDLEAEGNEAVVIG